MVKLHLKWPSPKEVYQHRSRESLILATEIPSMFCWSVPQAFPFSCDDTEFGCVFIKCLLPLPQQGELINSTGCEVGLLKSLQRTAPGI